MGIAAGRPGALRATLAGLLGALAAVAGAHGYETDQYSNRLVPIADSGPQLNQAVDRALAEVAERWRGPEERWRFARRVYWKLGGLHWVDRIERWAMKDPEVEKLPQRRRRSVFRDAPVTATRVNWFFGVGATIRLAGSLVGTDKLGHFFSQGVKYYSSHLLGWNEGHVFGRGRFNERWLFGQLTTSVYSNADLVANYEGYRFYRSLFEAGIVPGKGPLIEFRDGRAGVLRPFDWADHVNDFWDEAAFPSHLSPGLARYLRRRLPDFCADYERVPAAYLPAREAELEQRYAALGLKPMLENRMDHICAGYAATTHAAGHDAR